MNTVVSEDLASIVSAKGIDWSFFKGKTVLITGANGFLPAYMVKTLLHLNQTMFGPDERVKVIALIRNREKGAARFAEQLRLPHFSLIVQDVIVPINIERQVDIIIHAASQASPKYYSSDPVGTMLANVLGTHSVLELARRNQATVLYFSSGEVYGIPSKPGAAISEHDFGYIDISNVRACYSEGKRAGETMCISYSHQYGIPVKIVRPFHTYGPGMALDDGRVFADFVADIVHNRNIVMKSAGQAIRSFCYLTDATIGFFSVLVNGENASAYNVANPRESISIIDLAQIMADLFPERGLSVVRGGAPSSNEYLPSAVKECTPDISRLEKLGWSPKMTLADGFRRTVLSFDSEGS